MSKLETRLAAGQPIHVSITGLRLKRPWHIFAFFRYGAASLGAARVDEGNPHAAALLLHIQAAQSR